MNSQNIQNNRIAIIGMSCIYPDAFNVDEFWENIIDQRVSFRNFPSARLNEEYFNTKVDPSDKIYSSKGAFIKNYKFDRERFSISKSNYETADISHWLTLETTDNALNMSGIKPLLNRDLRKEVGVIIGNTLTGEQTRANQLRLRWPFVANVLKTVLKQENYLPEDINNLLNKTKSAYKSSFPEFKEDSLAGGLANTIAGRICNYYDFKGGGFTIDGACSSSLLSVIKGCESILQNDLKVAIVGGVDISLDPFELVGFSRTEALAKSKMLVFDENSNGFWPGEGCGILVLANYEFAKTNQLNILATIKGWGISSDGKGGITRPEKEGQKIALKKAASKANIQFSELDYIEAHGTGTKKGDETELLAIRETIEESIQNISSPIFIGSVKGNIGHTKAAAGIAGMIKAICITQKKIIPAASSNINPHKLFNQFNFLVLPNQSVHLNKNIPLKIGVNSMGFGGINTHVILEGSDNVNINNPKINKKLNHLHFDHEVFVFSEDSVEKLKHKIEKIKEISKNLSFAEFSDLSCTLIKFYSFKKCRLSVVASSPNELIEKLNEFQKVKNDVHEVLDYNNGIYYSQNQKKIKIGVLFPGQGNKFMNIDSTLKKIYPQIFQKIPANISHETSSSSTQIAQPSLVNTACIGLDILNKYEIYPDIAIGHSVGELACLYFSKVLSYEQVIALAEKRGEIMEKSESIKGSMLIVNPVGNETFLLKKIKQYHLNVACFNADDQWVLSGVSSSISTLLAELKDSAIDCLQLKVNNAFHSDLMKAIEPAFTEYINLLHLNHVQHSYVSTVNAEIVQDSLEIKDLLIKQLTYPVLFKDSVKKTNDSIDLWVELGTTGSLKKLLQSNDINNTIDLNLTGDTLIGVCNLLAFLQTFDQEISLDEHIRNRSYKVFDLENNWEFISNPCETIFFIKEDYASDLEINKINEVNPEQVAEVLVNQQNIEDLFKKELSNALDLDFNFLNSSSRLLDDLHLNSLYVVQLITKFAQKHQLKISNTLLDYSNASIDEIVSMFVLYNFNDSFNIDKNESSYKSEWVKTFINSWQLTQASILKELALFDLHETSDSFVTTLHDDVLLIKYFSHSEQELDDFLQLKDILIRNHSFNHLVFVYTKDIFSSFLKSVYKEKYFKRLSLIYSVDGIFKDDQFYLQFSSDKIDVVERKIENHEVYEPIFTFNTIRSNANVLNEITDTVLVVGGAKGIALECVRKMATYYQNHFLLVGRSEIEGDLYLKDNLELLKNLGISVTYFSADITKEKDVIRLQEYILKNKIIIHTFLHSAGLNIPQKLKDIQQNTLTATYRTKVDGFKNILSILNKDDLKLVISFGSVIGTVGMEGNGEYAFANQCLKNTIQTFQNKFVSIRFLNIEWSVWEEVGMGHNLGLLELLKLNGVKPISIDTGSDIFMHAIQSPQNNPTLFVSGKFKELKSSMHDLKNHTLRFVENVIEFYDDIEYVSEVSISPVTDPYLLDHVFDNNIIFPGVMGIEAGLQNLFYFKQDLIKLSQLSLSNVQFHNPIIFSNNTDEIKLRIVIERVLEDTYQIKLYSSISQFTTIHFSFEAVFKDNLSTKRKTLTVPNDALYENEMIYEQLLFHGSSFKVIKNYQYLTYKEIVANVDDSFAMNLFNKFLGNRIVGLPTNLMDGLLHSVQIGVPNKTLLPVAIKKIVYHTDELVSLSGLQIYATENYNDQNIYNYDIILINSIGECVVEFKEVSFKYINRVKTISYSKAQATILLNRLIHEKFDSDVHELFMSYGVDSKDTLKRFDGKPILIDHRGVSKSYSAGLQSLILSSDEVAIDMEEINSTKDLDWRNILSETNYQLAFSLSQQFNEDIHKSATRVWTIIEGLRKMGILSVDKIDYISMHDNLFIEFQYNQYRIINVVLDIIDYNDSSSISISIIR